MIKLKRIKIIVLLALTACTHITSAQKPNVLLIMADDIGLGDIGYYHKVRTGQAPIIATPNIDALIAEGMRFSDAHSPASLCAPTRFSMLTGNFSYRNTGHVWGVWNPETETGIDPSFTTIARIAKSGGYQTAFFGKWGLGGVWNGRSSDPSQYEKMDGGAQSFGFDYALELPQGIQNAPFAFYENGEWMKLKETSELVQLTFEQTQYDESERYKKREGLGDQYWDPSLAGPILTEKVVNYIKNQSGEKPFFLYYCSQAVHVPHTPAFNLNGVAVSNTTPNKHGDMIKELDVQVGMMVQALKAQGLYENTLVVFTSDNGGLSHYNAKGHESSNGYTGSKGSIYEGGHRVPFIAVWPGKIKPNSSSDVTVVGQDMVATMAALTESQNLGGQILDAANLLPLFNSQSKQHVRTHLLHQSQSKGGPYYALRQGEWKLVMRTEKREDFDNLEVIGLYNLNENQEETNATNLMDMAENKGRVEQMLKKYKELRVGGEATVK
ncbi:MAG: arylsulfatase [Cyclobacteriaceae bacterium]